MIFESILYLNYLNDDMAIFRGDAVEEKEMKHPFTGESFSDEMKFPCLQLSLDMWQNYSRPVKLHIKVDDVS